MTIIYNPNIGIIAKIIFKVEIKKKDRGVLKQQYVLFSRFCQHTFPSGLNCAEWLRLPLHSLNESQEYLCTDAEDELEVVNTTGRGG